MSSARRVYSVHRATQREGGHVLVTYEIPEDILARYVVSRERDIRSVCLAKFESAITRADETGRFERE